MWPFATDLEVFQDSFLLWHVSVIRSILWLNNIALYRYIPYFVYSFLSW